MIVAILSLILAVVSLIFGFLMLVFPGAFMKLSRVMDRQYSLDKLKNLLNKEISIEKFGKALERYIDVNEKLIRFTRIIGMFAFVVGILLLLAYLSLSRIV